jgi:hypothetical protein
MPIIMEMKVVRTSDIKFHQYYFNGSWLKNDERWMNRHSLHGMDSFYAQHV